MPRNVDRSCMDNFMFMDLRTPYIIPLEKLKEEEEEPIFGMYKTDDVLEVKS